MLANNSYVDRCSDSVLSSSTFSYLKGGELVACCSVSTRWRALASQDKLWERVAKQIFGDALQVPNFRTFLRQCISNSNDHIVDRIQAFANRISMGQNARFRCVIGPLQGSQTVGNQAVEIIIEGRKQGDGPVDLYSCLRYHVANLDFTENCIAVNGLGNLSLSMPPSQLWPELSTASVCVQSMSERALCVAGRNRDDAWATITLPHDHILDSPIVGRIAQIIRGRLDQLNTSRRRRSNVRTAVMYVGIALLLTPYVKSLTGL